MDYTELVKALRDDNACLSIKTAHEAADAIEELQGQIDGWIEQERKALLRSSAYGRKCRCSSALCLAIENIDGTDSGLTEISSDHDKAFIYRVGEVAKVDNFDEDRRNECAPGVHFFITRQEAVDY